MGRPRRFLMIAFAISVATLMSAQALAVGFAASSNYSSVTVNSGNDATAEYATIGYYTSSDGVNYNPVTSGAFSHGCVEYTKDNWGRYHIDATDVLINIPNLYVRIDGSGDYSLSRSITAVGGNIAIGNYRMYLDNNEVSDGCIVHGDTYYSLKIKCRVSEYGTTTTQPTAPVFNVLLSAQSLLSAVVYEVNNGFEFMSISQQAVEDMATENQATWRGDDDNPSYYDPVGGEWYYLVPDDSAGDGIAGVYITSGDDSTNINTSTNDEFNTTIKIPNDKKYLIKVYIKPRGISSGEVWVELTEGSTTYKSDDVSAAAFFYGQAKTYYLYKGNSQKLLQTDSSPPPDNIWMDETTESLKITIKGSTGGISLRQSEIKVEILFKDSV